MSPKSIVLVTGPSGYVGAHVFDAVLNAGYKARGTLRSEDKADFLKKKYSSTEYADDVSFAIVPDIQAPGALDDAVKDVEYICHVASPFFIAKHDPVKELIEPAVHGTKNVVNSALKAPHLKRLVIMSSFAAIKMHYKLENEENKTYTPEDWNTVTEEDVKKDPGKGYSASKTFAERAAWDMWKEAKPSWDLVTLNPPMLYGPPIHQIHVDRGIEGLNTSLARMVLGIQGETPDFKPKVSLPPLPAWVDVRDVAKAHVAALALPKGTNERFLFCSGIDYFEDGLSKLRARGVKGLGEPGEKCDPKNHFSIDSSKAREMLNFDPILFPESTEDTWDRLVELHLIEG